MNYRLTQSGHEISRTKQVRREAITVSDLTDIKTSAIHSEHTRRTVYQEMFQRDHRPKLTGRCRPDWHREQNFGLGLITIGLGHAQCLQSQTFALASNLTYRRPHLFILFIYYEYRTKYTHTSTHKKRK